MLEALVRAVEHKSNWPCKACSPIRAQRKVICKGAIGRLTAGWSMAQKWHSATLCACVGVKKRKSPKLHGQVLQEGFKKSRCTMMRIYILFSMMLKNCVPNRHGNNATGSCEPRRTSTQTLCRIHRTIYSPCACAKKKNTTCSGNKRSMDNLFSSHFTAVHGCKLKRDADKM